MRNLPDVPTLDVFLGLASAVLLLLALVYAARRRPETFGIFWRRPRRRDHHADLFQDVFLPESNRGLSFIGSLFCHLVGFSLIPWMQFTVPRVTMPDPEAHEIVRLDYRIPDIPVVSPEDLLEEEEDSSEESDNGGSEEEGASSKLAEAAAEAAPKKSEEASEGPTPPPEIATAPPKPEIEVFQQVFKVMLPEIVGKDRSLKEIILQTDSLLELPPEYAPQLPPVLAWTPNPRQLESGMVIEPGHQQPETIERWELPEHVSQLTAPNRETVLAELSVTPISVVVEDPALPVPAANVAPLAGLEMPEPVQPELPSLAEGEARTTLIALSQEPNPLTPSFLLEMGLRLGSLDRAMDEESSVEGEADEEEPESPPEVEQSPSDQPVETALDVAADMADTMAESTDAPTIIDPDAPMTTGEAAPILTEFDLFAAEGVSDVVPMTVQAVDLEAEGEGPGGAATEGAGADAEVAMVEVVDIASVRVGGEPGDPRAGGPAILELPVARGPGTGKEGEGEGKESPEENEGDGKGTGKGSGTLKPLPRKQYGMMGIHLTQVARNGHYMLWSV